MKTKDIERARLEHRSVYCIDKNTSDVLRCSVGLFGSFDSQFDVELNLNITSQPMNVFIEDGFA